MYAQNVGEKVARITEKTVEKTKDVTQRTKEKVKERLGRTETALQMQTKLEEQAQNTVTLAQVNDLYRSWFNSLNRKDGPVYLLYEKDDVEDDDAERESSSESAEEATSTKEPKDSSSGLSVEPPVAHKTIDIDPNALLAEDDPPKPAAGNTDNAGDSVPLAEQDKGPSRKLNFKHVFLRSKALEISLNKILSDSMLRRQIVQPSADDRSSPSFYLYSVLQITISCPPDIWAALLRSGTEAPLLTQYQVDWLCEIFSLLKLDWLDEVYHGERKEMAVGWLYGAGL